MPRVHEYRIGDVGLTALRDGFTRIRPETLLLSAADADVDRYSHLVEAGGMTEMPFTAYLLESAGMRILVDTGIADQQLPGMAPLEDAATLLDAMREATVGPTTVGIVVQTHLHFDHVGWNARTEADSLVPTFPNARHVIRRRDWDHFSGGTGQFGGDFERFLRPLEERSMIDLVDDEDIALTAELTLLPTFGHTPGH